MRFSMALFLAECLLLCACGNLAAQQGLWLLGEGAAWDSQLTPHDQKVVRPQLTHATFQYVSSGNRSQLIQDCENLLLEFPETRLGEVIESLLSGLRRDAQQVPPASLALPEAERTQDQQIECLLYSWRDLHASPIMSPGEAQLLDLPGTNPLFGTNAYTKVFYIGSPAIPALIAVLDDNSLTRTTKYSGGMPMAECIVWRRQDVAMRCLEAITSCHFYNRGWFRTELHQATPERRNAAVNNVRIWRALSMGKSQAESIRIQFELSRSNPTLTDGDRVAMLSNLGTIAGPETVLAELREMLRIWQQPQPDIPGVDRMVLEIRSPERGIEELLSRFDAPHHVQKQLKRFWDNTLPADQFGLILRYGGRREYEEIARRLDSPDPQDVKSMVNSLTPQVAARYGREWSLPLLARLLKQTEFTQERNVNGVSQPISLADWAIMQFQQLAGWDAGYLPSLPAADRLAAIARAREWWETTGQHELHSKVTMDRPRQDVVGDLLLSDAERAALELQLASTNVALRRRAVGDLTYVKFCTTRNALWAALRVEELPAEREKILRVLLAAPVTWELQPAVEAFIRERDDATQAVAGELLLASWKTQRSGTWQLQFDIRDEARKRLTDFSLSRDLSLPVRDQIRKLLEL